MQFILVLGLFIGKMHVTRAEVAEIELREKGRRLEGETHAAALVLVVDDVQEIVEELIALLALLDITALGAQSLAQAITILESEATIRVIACDVRLNRESGLEIIQRIADNDKLAQRPFKYMFMTGDPMRPDAIAAQEHCRVLTKPVQPRELIALFHEMLGIERSGM